MIASSCSTTRSVLPLSRRLCITRIKPPDIARMQSDARLVHDEERVHERGAEAGREIDALHFAAAEGARGTIEREITEADFAEIGQPRDDFAPQHLGGRVVRR